MQNKNKYILVFGIIPTKQNEKDGMVQREISIDSILKDYNRIYIENIRDNYNFLTYPKKYIKDLLEQKKCVLKDNVEVYKTIDSKNLQNLFAGASFIYIHSLWNVINIPLNIIEKFKNKIILDIHGCVPEEYLLSESCSDDFLKKINDIEKKVFNNINTLVAVSENMIQFYKEKYPNIKTRFLLLPIFNKTDIQINSFKSNDKLNIIYSGGIQPWQKTDLMLEFFNKISKNYNITILTPNIDYFKNNLDNNPNIIIKTVPQNKISEEYVNADIGIIFRDDILVNQIACPTKLIDYLTHGIIPCVFQPNIGDFNRLGYHYLTMQDVIKMNIPDDSTLKKIRKENFEIIKSIICIQENSIKELKTIIFGN